MIDISCLFMTLPVSHPLDKQIEFMEPMLLTLFHGHFLLLELFGNHHFF